VPLAVQSLEQDDGMGSDDEEEDNKDGATAGQTSSNGSPAQPGVCVCV